MLNKSPLLMNAAGEITRHEFVEYESKKVFDDRLKVWRMEYTPIYACEVTGRKRQWGGPLLLDVV